MWRLWEPFPAGRKFTRTVQLPCGSLAVRAGDCFQPYGVFRIVCLLIEVPTVFPSMCAPFWGVQGREVEGEQADKWVGSY